GTAAPGFAGPGTPEVQDALGLQLGWHGSGGEGPAQLAPVMLAALAVAAGLCRHALVYRTVTEATAAANTGRLGIGAGSRSVSGFAQWVIPFGAMSAANWLALHAVRHMHEFGTRREHLGEIALTARAHAALNPAAVYREPLTMDDYLAARMVTWPFGLYDCDVPVDGSTAVVVSSADAARDLPHPAVRIDAVGSAIRGRPVWDQWEDLTTMAARDAAAQLWARTDLKPADVDTIQLYDGFSWLTLAWIEALGCCQRGAGGPVREGRGAGDALAARPRRRQHAQPVEDVGRDRVEDAHAPAAALDRGARAQEPGGEERAGEPRRPPVGEAEARLHGAVDAAARPPA